MLALSDSQLQIVITATKAVIRDRRNLFLERVAARLLLLNRFTDDDVRKGVQSAAGGLLHAKAS
jgi:hypothetical protein